MEWSAAGTVSIAACSGRFAVPQERYRAEHVAMMKEMCQTMRVVQCGRRATT